MDEDSDLLPNKCGTKVDGGVDRIGQLPDEILLVILSFLQLKKAATTSVLSSRWLDLWKHIPRLKFDSYILPDNNDINLLVARRCKCIEIVNTVLQSHKALSLKKFTLALPFSKISKCEVTKWLGFVFSRQVESLKLNFIFSKKEGDEFVLEELLRESGGISLQPQTDLIFFRSLKRLFLRCLKVSGEDIELFLRNCPLLEQLKMECVTLTSDVEVCGEKLMLKHLDMDSCGYVKSIKVSAPNLSYLRFVGGKLLLENVPKLVEADFAMYTPFMVVYRFSSSTSCHFSQLQILKLVLLESKMLFQLQGILANGFQMPNLKKLVIICLETYKHALVQVTTALIWAFPRLEEFKLMYSCSRVGEEQPAYMEVETNGERSPHQHLKVFELQMSPRQAEYDDIIELMIYISDNCVALRKIIIGRQSTPVDPANRDLIAQRLQGKIPNHIQLELFSTRF